jgi:hypothetical protein
MKYEAVVGHRPKQFAAFNKSAETRAGAPGP